jgi:serine/threonine-protein kinase HipA
MGGFRFKEDLDGEFINVSESLKIPPLTDIRELIYKEKNEKSRVKM